MSRVAKVLFAATVASLLAMAVATAGASAAASTSAACTPASNIEAIVDDSISMEFTDANRLRVQAMNLLIDTLGKGTTLGAVEFGSAGFENNPPAADTVFPPQPVGPNGTAMRTALDQKIHADNGATDYNAAFAQSDADNPGANARIFLTDGGHDVGTYNEGHTLHNVPTYVIGFGGIAAGEDQARLQKIASDTGGQYFPLKDSAQLQSVMNTIEAALDLPDAAAPVHRPAQQRPEQDALDRDRRRQQVGSDHAHLDQPAGQVQALGPAPGQQGPPARGRVASRQEARQAEGLAHAQLDLRRDQSLASA